MLSRLFLVGLLCGAAWASPTFSASHSGSFSASTSAQGSGGTSAQGAASGAAAALNSGATAAQDAASGAAAALNSGATAAQDAASGAAAALNSGATAAQDAASGAAAAFGSGAATVGQSVTGIKDEISQHISSGQSAWDNLVELAKTKTAIRDLVNRIKTEMPDLKSKLDDVSQSVTVFLNKDIWKNLINPSTGDLNKYICAIQGIIDPANLANLPTSALSSTGIRVYFLAGIRLKFRISSYEFEALDTFSSTSNGGICVAKVISISQVTTTSTSPSATSGPGPAGPEPAGPEPVTTTAWPETSSSA